MYQKMNFYDFERAFREAGRASQFTYNGLSALFDHLEEVEEQIGEPIVIDVISLCCDYSEYDLEGMNHSFDPDNFCEEEGPHTLEEWAEALAEAPIRVYDVCDRKRERILSLIIPNY